MDSQITIRLSLLLALLGAAAGTLVYSGIWSTLPPHPELASFPQQAGSEHGNKISCDARLDSARRPAFVNCVLLKDGLEFQYPSRWRLRTTDQLSAKGQTLLQIFNYDFADPDREEGSWLSGTAKIELFGDKVSSELTVDDWFELRGAQTTPSTRYLQRKTVVAGRNAIFLEGSIDGSLDEVLQVYLMGPGGRGYGVFYYGDPSYRDVFFDFLDSLRFRDMQ